MPSLTLAVLDHPAAADAVLSAAGRASLLIGGGHVTALVVRTPPQATILPSEEILTPGQKEGVRSREAQRAAGLRTAFDFWRARSGSAAEWVDVEGVPHDIIEARGVRSDLIVVEQPGRHDYGTTGQAIHAALFRTGRPVLVVPPDPRPDFGRRVAIAWRDDAHTLAAALFATRLLSSAERIDVIGDDPAVPPVLVEHGIAATMHLLRVDSGDALLAKTSALRTDLLVMGAYVHSPLYALLLGGMTGHVLAHAEMPVLMRH